MRASESHRILAARHRVIIIVTTHKYLALLVLALASSFSRSLLVDNRVEKRLIHHRGGLHHEPDEQLAPGEDDDLKPPRRFPLQCHKH